eukprot:5271947-Amphidinium_carterae.2
MLGVCWRMRPPWRAIHPVNPYTLGPIHQETTVPDTVLESTSQMPMKREPCMSTRQGAMRPKEQLSPPQWALTLAHDTASKFKS